MPKCLKCNKIIERKNRQVTIYVTKADGTYSILDEKIICQCWSCSHPKEGTWTKTLEGLSECLGDLLTEVKRSPHYTKPYKEQFEIACLIIQRMPYSPVNGIFNMDNMKKAIYLLMDQVEVY